MKKRIISILLAALLLISVIPMTAISVSAAEEYPAVPTSFTAPRIYATSDNHNVRLNVVHPEDFMRHDDLAHDNDRWADAEGGETDNNYRWNGYGMGKSFDEKVQIDWRIPGGEWHYTADWDTDPNASNSVNYDHGTIWGSDTGTYFNVFKNSDCFNAAEGDVFYPVKDYFDEFTDGYDNFYLYDQSKELEFRARYISEVTTGGYYDNYETEETISYILSPWSEVYTYGGNNTTQAELPVSLDASVIENPVLYPEDGYMNGNLVKFYSYPNDTVAYLSSLGLDIEEATLEYGNMKIHIEASLDNENWEEVTTTSANYTLFDLDIADVWSAFIREDGQGWGEYVWETRDVYIRTRYSYYYEANDYTTDPVSTIEDTLMSDYSNVLKINVPGIDVFDINVNYKTYGASNYSKESFICNENTAIGWFDLAPLEGFFVEKVVVNGNVMYDKADESTYELLEWYDAEEFRFIGDPLATENLEIDVYFGGEAPDKHTISYTLDPLSTGTGRVVADFGYDSYTLSGKSDSVEVNQGSDVEFTVKADEGCGIAELIVDGVKHDLGVDVAAQCVITVEDINEDHTFVVRYERFSYYCTATSQGKGKVEVISPHYYDTNDWYVNSGDTFEVKATAEDGYEILEVYINGEKQDIGTAKINTITMTLKDISQEQNVSVVFSDDAVEYVDLTINWNEGGICNGGEKTEKVVKGRGYGITIKPDTGYQVAKITDGDTVVTNFVGDSYYVENLTEDRTVTVEFEKIPEKILWGDVNRDGRVTVTDATLIQKNVAKMVEFDDYQLTYGDVDADGKITVRDASAVQKLVANVIQKFPAEKV